MKKEDINEALETLKLLKDFVLKNNKNGLDRRFIIGSCDILEKELKELEERREMMKRFNEACVPMILDNETEKKLKALEIIKSKGIDIDLLKYNKDLEHYNFSLRGRFEHLTQEEYELLREVLL